jgi:hypothetical protein
MTSAKQIKANQENAQHSQGPVSAAGRKKAAVNSVTHGLTAQTIVLPEHEKEPYRLYGEGIINDLAPVGTYEAALVRSIIDARWRIHQIASIEAALYAVGLRTHADEFEGDPSPERVVAMCRLITFEEKHKELDRLHRYESRLMRQVAKDTQLLTQVQTARKAQKEKDKEPIQHFGSPIESAECSQNGFVLQNANFDSQPPAKASPSAASKCQVD